MTVYGVSGTRGQPSQQVSGRGRGSAKCQKPKRGGSHMRQLPHAGQTRGERDHEGRHTHMPRAHAHSKPHSMTSCASLRTPAETREQSTSDSKD